MDNQSYNLLLADDDADDCMFFREALEELPLKANLTTVNDGEQLMRLLDSMTDKLPDAIFLDLNMPRKTGLECLSEIKSNSSLSGLTIFIFSTSLDKDVVNHLYETGADRYIRKPGEFSKLKQVIHEAIKITVQENSGKTEREKFVILA
jgi:CheY-like chemotaxis protein